MGLFDSAMDMVKAKVQEQGGYGAVLGGLLANDGAHGGLDGLVQKFNQAGLGNVIGSWIGKGENLPVSADQIKDVLGSDVVAGMAAKLGIDPSQLSGKLSEMLPGLVDKLTPHGEVPAAGLGNSGDLMGMLGGLMK